MKSQWCPVSFKVKMEVYLQAGRANDNDCLLRTYLGHFDSVD
jgi:hypothetical protein